TTFEERQQNREIERMTFKRGHSGTEVLNLQRTLNLWRIENGKKGIAEDGTFGPETEKAIKEFQAANKLQVDGLVGPETKASLRQVDNKFADGVNDEIRRQRRLDGEPDLRTYFLTGAAF